MGFPKHWAVGYREQVESTKGVDVDVSSKASNPKDVPPGKFNTVLNKANNQNPEKDLKELPSTTSFKKPDPQTPFGLSPEQISALKPKPNF